LLFSLFGAVAHRVYGLPGVNIPGGGKKKVSPADIVGLREAAIQLSEILAVDDPESLKKADLAFVNASTSQTDNVGPRTVRLKKLFTLAFE